MSIFKGAGTALVTPMNADGSVNFPKMKELIEFQIANGIDALIICGTTGEATTISDEDQIECVRFAKEVAAGRCPIIAGAGSNDTAHCIELAVACEKAGADAISSVPPFYWNFSADAIYQYYKDLSESVSIPLVIYNVQLAGIMNRQLLTRIAQLPNVKGMKYTEERKFSPLSTMVLSSTENRM